ncbi:fumarylacetoacetate hydrolase family protein [Aestuariivita boseongensis]|uniref:fumarylacetoacetate hydrolase family protein n=1 Tax=Aestuariivita boseongensis TaxID=1470562 RepID=UPI00068077DD|nr:fumarylacetoacetate hydrolase family protein [Aestuariivita boseongensis]
MKLKRVARGDAIRNAAEDPSGTWRDVTDVTGDLSAKCLANDGLAALHGADLTALPELGAYDRLLPCVGSVGKFMCIGLNYSDHAEEAGMAIPDHPILFLKANSAIAGAQDDLLMPRGSKALDWEVELGVIIGKPAKYVDEARALDHVAGYCVVNDVSERDFQLHLTGQWTKGKSCDTFGPIGPWFVTADAVPDPQALSLWAEVNGQRMQAGHSSTMIFTVAQIIAHLSQLMTLHPGDVIATGTPPGVGMGMKPPRYLKPGDEVKAGIEGLGEQVQRVIEDQS